MTRPAFMAFGGPCAGAWFPLDDGPVTFAFVPEELDDETLDAFAFGPAAPAVNFARSEHRYDLARFAFNNQRTGERSTFTAWVHHPDRDEVIEEITATLKVIAWLAGYRPVWRLLPRSA